MNRTGSQAVPDEQPEKKNPCQAGIERLKSLMPPEQELRDWNERFRSFH